MHNISLDSMQQWIQSNRISWLTEYKQFLSFASVSADPQYATDMLRCVDWLTNYLHEIGFEIQIWPTNGHPTIFASHLKAGKDRPTILIYNHYDVQPIDPLNEWISPPFEPIIRDDNIYARGAQDNKGQCFYVLQALKLILSETGELPINVKLCIEGEEEIGSYGLSKILPHKQQELQADYLAIVDAGIRTAGIPALAIGLRGMLTLELSLKSAKLDLHSGTHGGVAPNPIHALVELLANLHDDQGMVNIPGFYEQVINLSPQEHALLNFSFDAQEYTNITGADPCGGEHSYTPLERSWIRPTLEINGIYGGYTGSGFKTVLPATAHAKISCRLVPNQDVEVISTLISDYLKQHTPIGMQLSVKINPGKGQPIRTSPYSSVVKCFKMAFEEVFKHPCEFILAGYSIPIVAELSYISNGEPLLFGLGLYTDQIHAPNEHFGIDRIEQGIMVFARALEYLAKNYTNTRFFK